MKHAQAVPCSGHGGVKCDRYKRGTSSLLELEGGGSRVCVCVSTVSHSSHLTVTPWLRDSLTHTRARTLTKTTRD